MSIQKAINKEAITKYMNVNDYYKKILEAEEFREFYNDSSNCYEIVEAICDIAKNKEIEIISFDVFDTALLREGKPEILRFLESAEWFVGRCSEAGLAVRFEKKDVFLARIMAAKAAYSISPNIAGNREGRLRDIARITCDLLGHPELADDYVTNELLYEAASLIANPMLNHLEEALPDIPFIYVSDMYIESFDIRTLLSSKFGIEKIYDVYSSADLNGSKRTGGIFSYLEGKYRTRGENILHIGDNLWSDYKMPKKSGWNAFYLPVSEKEKRKRQECYLQLKNQFSEMQIDIESQLAFNM
ncbi:hypothetical protein HPQ64_12640 [Rhizobiales bacterium]|uniref:hypothetical protein n=1 Tax=Hongsoonwoonella zoysiae TaxID=2821844 RepID=UPI001560060D|nr:hypothetical protein [Hongsoonwoonella zoysiae]NRG18537.1 hypothetical protein [Hongsoonwoonella zoysiae]